jgi:cysteine desulfurase
MAERAYLDWNATAPLAAAARAAMVAAFDVVGNPSSVHGEGRAARSLIEQARAAVAAFVGAQPRHVTFTSGGSEANVLALTPALESPGAKVRDRLLMSAIEHPSVRGGHRFSPADAEDIPVTGAGVVDLAALEARLATLGAQGISRPLVSIMHANNETGVVQPVAAAAAIVHRAGGLLHVDAVQSAGRISCDINILDADLLTLSGHKLGAPKGIGALVKRSEALHIGEPVLRGSGQERGVRAGTENILGIVGFGAVAEVAGAGLREAARIAKLRDSLEQGLTTISPEAIIFGAGAERVPNTTLFAVPGIKAETALIALDLEGIAVSSGAACSSGKVAASHVLAAMGVAAPLAAGAIRVSLGAATGEREIDLFLKTWRKLVGGLSKGGRDIAA